MPSKYPDKSASTTSVCPVLNSRSTWRTASKAYAPGSRRVVPAPGLPSKIGSRPALWPSVPRDLLCKEFPAAFACHHLSGLCTSEPALGTIRSVPELFRQFVQPTGLVLTALSRMSEKLVPSTRCATIIASKRYESPNSDDPSRSTWRLSYWGVEPGSQAKVIRIGRLQRRL